MIILRNWLFSDSEKSGKGHKTKLSEHTSVRGIGRSALIGNIGGALGTGVGHFIAEDADKKGKSDREIVKDATLAGALTGGVTQPFIRAALHKQNPFSRRGLLSMGLGAAGGALGARKNTKTRLSKRLRKEYEEQLRKLEELAIENEDN